MQQHDKGISVIDTKNMTIHLMLSTFDIYGRLSIEVSENNIDAIIIHGNIRDKKDKFHYIAITVNLKEDVSFASSDPETREGKLEQHKWIEYPTEGKVIQYDKGELKEK